MLVAQKFGKAGGPGSKLGTMEKPVSKSQRNKCAPVSESLKPRTVEPSADRSVAMLKVLPPGRSPTGINSAALVEATGTVAPRRRVENSLCFMFYCRFDCFCFPRQTWASQHSHVCVRPWEQPLRHCRLPANTQLQPPRQEGCKCLRHVS